MNRIIQCFHAIWLVSVHAVYSRVFTIREVCKWISSIFQINGKCCVLNCEKTAPLNLLPFQSLPLPYICLSHVFCLAAITNKVGKVLWKNGSCCVLNAWVIARYWGALAAFIPRFDESLCFQLCTTFWTGLVFASFEFRRVALPSFAEQSL